MGLSGGQRFAQLPNSGFESASLVLVIAVFLRQTGHFSLELLEPRNGFDDNAGACGWSNAGHKIRDFWEIEIQLRCQEWRCQVPFCGQLSATPDPRVNEWCHVSKLTSKPSLAFAGSRVWRGSTRRAEKNLTAAAIAKPAPIQSLSPLRSNQFEVWRGEELKKGGDRSRVTDKDCNPIGQRQPCQ